jgi:DNA-binding LytR/AlgR family response regulator
LSERKIAVSSFHVLVVDDEPPAVDELRFLLEQEPTISRVTCASSTDEARRLLTDERFDAVFLDIEMPDQTGLDFARELFVTGPVAPLIVFVTAYERHAVEAFEVDAVDYLLKPVRPDRLNQALRRLSAARPDPVLDVPAELSKRIAVDVGGRTVFLERTEVHVVEAARDYVRLHTGTKTYLVRTPISAIETAWSGLGFVRVHRSYIVAVEHVTELRADDGGTSVVVGDKEIPVSRTYARDLKSRLLAQHQP